ncbi:DNA-directed RNA polymerase subunit beta [Staphylococcus condimenti]|uniref:DNA-directed RNA polymerase subunit beta n=1 Tax=Staphylococcus condimenti TaxID=70255 RepID=A0A143PED9_9STAP|nr:MULTISPECIES: DNA-directed RNA polymerase subunit beta [Staphylococcus]AMY06643.1 hypothetical protein A4G25_12155 [Staphylococcus condimenti]APR60524.1 hypothetical protein BTZ13_04575 [Staphylococcus condimenti]MDK8645841.1 DNA-directed RNA polymerase subunit beta [Staphylococcus condimenti]OFP03516.1 hypothetical protein HMPREF3007_07740 [Staphylococcus sp. HMSC065E08]PNZ61553.1 DNA-directed RNA polymerase subunit beta [Staphylococcus condimenti]
MIKYKYRKLTHLPIGFGIIIIVTLIILMFFVGIIIGYLLNHENPISFFDYQTWRHFKQLFGG